METLFDEALKIVENLNEKTCEYLEKGKLTYPLFEFVTDGFSVIIKFMGHHRLWFSDEDEREFYEEANEYEPLEKYVRREAQKIINQISGIKL